MRAEEFDKRFDSGEDVSEYFDIENAKRPAQEQKRVNIDASGDDFLVAKHGGKSRARRGGR